MLLYNTLKMLHAVRLIITDVVLVAGVILYSRLSRKELSSLRNRKQARYLPEATNLPLQQMVYTNMKEPNTTNKIIIRRKKIDTGFLDVFENATPPTK